MENVDRSCILHKYVVVGIMVIVFFFNDTATTEIYTLSLHDALPIYPASGICFALDPREDNSLRIEMQDKC